MKKNKPKKSSIYKSTLKKVTKDNIKDFIGYRRIVLTVALFGLFISLFLAIDLYSPSNNFSELPQTGTDNGQLATTVFQDQGTALLFIILLVILVVISIYIFATQVFTQKKVQKRS